MTPSDKADQLATLEAVLERVANITGAKNDSALARALSVTPQTVSSWRRRGTIPYEVIAAFAAQRLLSLNYLLLGRGTALWTGGKIDLILAAAIAEEFGEAAEAVRGRDLELFPSWALLGHNLGLIYNRVIQQLNPGAPFGDLVAEEVRYFREMAISRSVSGKPLRPHPEELLYSDSLGIPDHEIYGKGVSKLDLRRKICVTVDGKIHAGFYVITGTRRLGVTVYYQDKSHTDARNYRPKERAHMEGIAHHLLWELVTGKVLSSATPEMQRATKKRSAPRH